LYKIRKAATSSLSAEKLTSPSQQNDEEDEVVETEEASRKRGKGKDIAIISSMLKALNVEKMAFRPISRAKFFDFENLKTKGLDLRKFTDPQGWSDFLSTEESTFEDLVNEFYGHMVVKEKKEEKVLVSSVKGVKVTITQESLSKALNIPNKGNQLYNSVGTKGVSHNHHLSFDDNKVLKLSIGYAKHLFKCAGP